MEKKKPAKKEVKKPARQPTTPTAENLKLVREKCAVIDYPLATIKKVLDCTWKEAVALRHAALKGDKA